MRPRSRPYALAVAASLVAGLGLAAPAAAEPKAADPLDEARARLAEAEKGLVEAQQLAGDMRHRADSAAGDATEARRDLGNLARAAYATGPTELVSLATLIDSPAPEDTMRRAALATLVAEHQDAEWDAAVDTLGKAKDLRAQADQIVQSAKIRLNAARSTVKGIRNRDVLAEIGKGGGSGAGASDLAAKCVAADVVIDICASPPWTERNLTFDAVIIERYAHVSWPEIKDVGGWRPSDPFPDHPSGRAVDIMMPNGGGKPADVALGNEIAEYFQDHAAEYGIYYMIWRQRMWRASDPVGRWTQMSDRGSPTANHMDHVHISVTNGHTGTAFREALARANR